MRICAVSDLHVDRSPGNAMSVVEIARRVAHLGPEVFIVAGDVSPALPQVEAVLRALAELAPVRLFVPGNHDLWLAQEERAAGLDSGRKYRQELPAACRRAGFHYLPGSPLVWRGVAFAGTMGWFDYSFRDRQLDDRIPRAAYQRNRYRALLWNDGRFADWRASDDQVTVAMCEELRAGLEDLEDRRLETVVVVTHHLPFIDLLPAAGPQASLAQRFTRAFLGSARLGEVILDDPRVRHVLCGHLHLLREACLDGVRAQTCSIGTFNIDDRVEVAERVRRSVRVIDWPDPDAGEGVGG